MLPCVLSLIFCLVSLVTGEALLLANVCQDLVIPVLDQTHKLCVTASSEGCTGINVMLTFDNKTVLAPSVSMMEVMNYLQMNEQSNNTVKFCAPLSTTIDCQICSEISQITRQNGTFGGCASTYLQCYGSVVEPKLDLGCHEISGCGDLICTADDDCGGGTCDKLLKTCVCDDGWFGVHCEIGRDENCVLGAMNSPLCVTATATCTRLEASITDQETNTTIGKISQDMDKLERTALSSCSNYIDSCEICPMILFTYTQGLVQACPYIVHQCRGFPEFSSSLSCFDVKVLNCSTPLPPEPQPEVPEQSYAIYFYIGLGILGVLLLGLGIYYFGNNTANKFTHMSAGGDMVVVGDGNEEEEESDGIDFESLEGSESDNEEAISI